MFFRNLSCYRFTSKTNLDSLAAKLHNNALRPVGPLELSTAGFVPPLGDDGDLFHWVGDAMLVRVATQERLLPSDVVNRALSERLKEIAERQERRVGAKERKSIREDLLTQMLPQAFVRQRGTYAYFTRDGWLVIDHASRKIVEGIVSLVREAAGSFPCVPMAPEESPRALMTSWVIHHRNMPTGLVLGDQIELRDPCEAGAVVRCSNQDLEVDEIREHLRSGKQVFRLALVFNDRISFVLDDALCVHKLRFLDVVQDELGEKDHDSRIAELDATFAIMSGELKVMLGWMATTFGISDAPAVRLDGGDAAPEMREPTKQRVLIVNDGATKMKAALKKAGLGMSITIGNSLTERLNDCDLTKISPEQLQWLEYGERGASSETMFARLSGISTAGCAICHPLDPQDLARCRKLLEQVPAFAERLNELRDLSEQWNALVDVWGTLCATMDDECPKWRDGGTAPAAHEFMKQIGC